MTIRIPAYPKVYNVGHREVAGIFDGQPVVIQEKVDGSQFSFGVLDGQLHMRSKGAEVHAGAADKNFAGAAETVARLFGEGLLPEGTVYRGEVLSKPKHNTLAYDRAPAGHIILFDVQTGEETYLQPIEASVEAIRLGLEYVPTWVTSTAPSHEDVLEMLKATSVLGGCPIEGLVFKNYRLYGVDKKALMAKHVSEAFKEVHGGEWRKNNPTQGDIVQELIARYTTPARYQKAVQHLRDAGLLDGSPKDIGPLIREVQKDIQEEEGQEIRDALFTYFWHRIQRGVTAGLPAWYKDRLLEDQFDESDELTETTGMGPDERGWIG